MVRVIDDLDPGAVPGASTTKEQGGEIASTGVERRIRSFGIVPPKRTNL